VVYRGQVIHPHKRRYHTVDWPDRARGTLGDICTEAGDTARSAEDEGPVAAIQLGRTHPDEQSQLSSSMEPLIVALYDEYYECLDSGDVWGARRTFVRHYVVSIPKRVWVFCYEALKHWAKTLLPSCAVTSAERKQVLPLQIVRHARLRPHGGLSHTVQPLHARPRARARGAYWSTMGPPRAFAVEGAELRI
jgi:hypothetical protein